jgi:hypothetical protein
VPAGQGRLIFFLLEVLFVLSDFFRCILLQYRVLHHVSLILSVGQRAGVCTCIAVLLHIEEVVRQDHCLRGVVLIF